jgi:hypothetical protein
MDTAEAIAIIAAGVFFLSGLLVLFYGVLAAIL